MLQNIKRGIMEFRTAIKTNNVGNYIQHSQRLMLIGSCFSDNIGSKMQNALMNVDINPFGTVYNPASIANEIKEIVSGREITSKDLFQASGMWNHFGFHSHFSSATQTVALENMNNRLKSAHENLKKCDWIIVTLGTSIVYEYKKTNTIVSNCHKLPSVNFTRRMLTLDEVKHCLETLLSTLFNYNPHIKVIFTVSPIRHISDGLEQNQLSKSILRVAVSDIVATYHEHCCYFPAYEIMMDDLRDYRFYAADMVHPSDVAVDYIWNTFKATFFNDNTSQIISRCERIAKRLAHRPMTDNQTALIRFQQDTQEILSNLVHEYPYLRDLPQLKNISCYEIFD